MIEKNSAAFV